MNNDLIESAANSVWQSLTDAELLALTPSALGGILEDEGLDDEALDEVWAELEPRLEMLRG